MNETVFKPLSDLEAAIEACDMVTFARIIVYGSRYVAPPCADCPRESHPTDAVIIGQND